MKLIAGLFLILYAAERIVETFWRRPKFPGKIVAPYSLPLILIAYVSFYLIILWDWFVMDDEQFSKVNCILGATLVIASIIGRNWSISTLGSYHSTHIEIRDQHVLVQSGPYKFVRNPYYLSNIIEAFGLPLIVNSGRAFMIVGLFYLPLLMHRLVIEERALEGKFKASFAAYRTQVPSLIPRCLRRGTLKTVARDGK